MAFPIYKQLAEMDCGPTCLRMIAEHYGRAYAPEKLNRLTRMNREGTSLLRLRRAAEKIGFRTLAAAVTFEQLDNETPLPCIVLWNQNHFVVIPPQDYSGADPRQQILVADPEKGLVQLDKAAFLECWLEKDSEQGVVLMLEPAKRPKLKAKR
ncbi:cysteine peptidase family C39 domain-containing protein [Chitinophaga japonensis]|uniref:ATP-binding cassette subfamily B protein n=1 Tax=Chitinophaga japonensis TaxID=104662 RepID=A0A562T3L7_CHIJA|nr:cysteine peptidase family C39 domain-containing protein [Chitinophaga japonensis]TWI87898.1 ATP-binding cassette subfamily B protein [Chitinophaga japonensis]